ncbi:armadillo-type protein [Melampsora americana]|nr:armadillo-type protein [Melampsora americana]
MASATEVKSWVASTSPGQGVSDDEEIDEVNMDELTWDNIYLRARPKIITSKISIRIPFLTDELLRLVTGTSVASQAHLSDLIKLLFQTIPRYEDSASRNAVLNVLETLIRRNDVDIGEAANGEKPKLMSTIIKWISHESAKLCNSAQGIPTSAGSTRLAMLIWSCHLLGMICQSHKETKSENVKDLTTMLNTLGQLLDSTHDPASTRPVCHKSAMVITRRVIRNNHEQIPQILEILVQPSSTAANACLLGLVIDVSLRLRVGKERDKGSVDGVGVGYISTFKDKILQWWISQVLSSRTQLPSRTTAAFGDFFRSSSTADDYPAKVATSAHKMMLRSPEIAMPALSIYLDITPHKLSAESRLEFLPHLLSASKSSKSEITTALLPFFKTLFHDIASPHIPKIAEEVSLPLKTGKISSPEHRAALLNFLGSLRPGGHSSKLVSICCDTLMKETNEQALYGLRNAITHHLSFILSSDGLDAPTALAITKAMQDIKPLTRRTACDAIGLVFWKSNHERTDSEPVTEVMPSAVELLASPLSKAFEANLKNASTNPLTSAAGPLEGYVAISLANTRLFCEHPLISAIRKNNPVLTTLTTGPPKPNFMYLEKLYRKSTFTVDESMWLVRALDSVFGTVLEQLKRDSAFRLLFAQAVLFLCTESPHHLTRQFALSALCCWFKAEPSVTISFLLDSSSQLLTSGVESGDASKWSRMKSVFSSLFKATADWDEPLRVMLLSECFVVCHHVFLDPSSFFWIDLVHCAGLDPRSVITSEFTSLQNNVTTVLKQDSNRHTHLADAAYRSISSLCFVVPDIAVPLYVTEIVDSLKPDAISFIGTFETGVWNTPVGQTYVDVLSSQKDTNSQTKNRKDNSIEAWELELRADLERKKAGGTKVLSKAEKALVEAQLAKETETRMRVATTLHKLRHVFKLIHSLIEARKGAEQTLADYSASLVKQLINVMHTDAMGLVAPEAISAFTALGRLCITKLGSLQGPLTIAVLRGMNTQGLSTEMTAEPLSDLVTRVLYKLRSLGEQQMLDGLNFAYFSPFLTRVIQSKGIGVTPTNIEEGIEQVALVMDIMVFSGSEACKIHDLRSTIMQDCLTVIGAFPQLIKPATTALISVGSTISVDASDKDIQTLLGGILSSEAQARYAALQAALPLDLTDIGWSAEVFLACHDDDERNANLASDLWAENGLKTHEEGLRSILPLLEHRASPIRNAAAKSLASAVRDRPHLSKEILQAISSRYEFLARELVPEYDQFGMIIPESLDRQDPWPVRVAQADALCALAPLWTTQDIIPLFDFLVVKQSLGDRSEAVRTRMLAAGNAAIDLHGAHHLEKLIATFEEVLTRGSTGSDAADHVTESAVLLFGRLARHLSATDGRLVIVIDRLVDALKTPSEVVQSAVSDCLPPLVRLQRDRVPILIQRLLQDTLTASKYAERRGAAYGLAGAIKGRGITSLKDFSIIDSLRDALEDKKNTRGRQGALFAFEILASSLGRLFEPYLVQATSILLSTFGDGSADVREAIQDTARVIMKGLSGHAVKLIMPALLEGLEDKQWRTKKGAIELMGAMAYLAPKQLSMSLPTIIPRLTEVLTDTHAQVRAAANASLKKFGEVVSNPEISAMQDILLAALVDPARKTARALEGLLGTAFVHYIDTSSLALVVPIIERGLRERSADIKRKATQIVGNLATLAEAKDLSPYLPQLMPKVRQVLVDPVPEARATAAKALGSLVERLGEDSFPELVPSLFETLRADASGVDQQGAAQGLSEIMSGLGIEKLEDLLPDIISNTSSPRAYVREGFISLLIFLPATYGERFSPYLGRIIQPVLNGLADDSDYVRDASMKAGRMIITNHSAKAVDLLLPELEHGLFHESWRIRQSSIQLIGDLLFRVSGITAKADIDVDGEDDDAVAPTAEASRVALVDVLGKDRRDRVLAAIYIIRQDSSGIVRSTSVHIWKALVHNTPKTVRDIMPVLMQTLIRTLASSGEEQREAAARTLGELVKKLGDSVLSTITNILQKAMLSDDIRTRQGVSLAIIDVISSITQNQLEDHEGPLIAIVRMALVDQDPSVRSTAAQAFDSLQQRVGSRAVEETLPTLLSALRQSGAASEAALSALKELMRIRAASILPRLLPVLTKSPITAFNARALASLVSVSGSSVNKYLCGIVDGLRSAWLTERDEDTRSALDSSLRVLFDSIKESDALNTLMMHLLELAKSPLPAQRMNGCGLFEIFCSSNTCDGSEYHILWIRQLFSLFEDPVPEVIDSSWMAMDEMVKTIPKTSLDSLVVPLRRTIETTGLPGRDLPGLCRPSGLRPIMPILLQGILTGTAEQREQAALAFGDVVERTSQEFIKPYVTQITGPLIRIVGDRFPAPVKSAILQTSATLLQQIPQFVKPFFPQLQRTFVKCAADMSSGTVRSRAVTALGLLMKHQPRVDPLVTELLGAIRGAEDDEIQESMTSALAAATCNGGMNISDNVMSSLLSFAEETLQAPRHLEPFANAMARLVSALAQTKTPGFHSLITHLLADPTTPLAITCLRDLVDHADDAIQQMGLDEPITSRILAIAAEVQPPIIGRPAREAKEILRSRGRLADD